MQFTTAYAPTEDDLAEDFFGTPVLTMTVAPPKSEDVDEVVPENA